MFRSIRKAFALTDGLRELRQFSFATFLVERIFFLLQYLSPANLLFGTRKRAHDQALDEDEMKAVTIKRGARIDCYVSVWLIVLILCAFLADDYRSSLKALFIFLPLFRVFEIMQVAVNMVLFDHLRMSRRHSMSSITRTLVMGLWNFVEMILCFGIVYSTLIEYVRNATTGFDPYYFSAVTQLTIGYGYLSPFGVARYVSALQGILGVLYVVIIISRFVALLPRIESVQASENQGH